MTIFKRSMAGAIVLAVLGSAQLWAEPATQPIEDAVAHLSDTDPAVRKQAVRTLREAGAAARPALEAAAAGDDPEIAARARDLLNDVADEPTTRRAALDEPSPEILQYSATAATEKRQKINELATTNKGIIALTKIWLLETDPELRSAIFDQLVAESSTAAASLLAEGNVASAELLLQAAVDRQTPQSPKAYAAYWLSRGKTDEAIQRWASRGGKQPADAWAEQVLAALFRAKGDGQLAVEHARASGDADVLQETLLWAGEWSQLAIELRKENAAPQGPRDIALLIGTDTHAGDDKAIAADVARLGALVHNEQQAEAAADILLLVSRPDDAVKILIDSRQFASAYQVLEDRGKSEQAADLLAAHDGESTEDALLLRAAATWELGRLGLKKQCADMADRVATENEKNKFPRVYVALAEAERQGNLTEKSWAHFSTAITSVDESAINWYVSRAFPSQGNAVDWSSVWMASIGMRPDRPAKELFARIRQAYDKTMPLDDLTAAASSVDLSVATNRPYGELVWEAARRIKIAGREADAVKLVETAAANAIDGDLYVHLGDWAAEKKDWTLAATRYESAWQKDRTQALPLYLQGWALENGGRGVAGRERMTLAHLLPLGDEVCRADLIRGLDIRGLDDAAIREADFLIRTGDPLSSSSEEALRVAAEHADEQGNFAVAAALWQRSTPAYLTATYWFENHAQYLHLPNAVRESRARALLAAGDWDGARREVNICLETLPVDSSIVIDLVPELDKHGRHEEANALFAKMFAIQQALCDRYPKSAFQLNEYAWLAAKCHRELDKALDAAKRGVELDPKAVDVLDTLAEVYFQRGEFKQAIDEEKKCVELSPAMPFHRKQIERFEAAASK